VRKTVEGNGVNVDHRKEDKQVVCGIALPKILSSARCLGSGHDRWYIPMNVPGD